MAANSKPLVLLVEDDPGIQGLVSVLFARRGIGVDVVSDGEQALRLLRDRAYAVILLDLMLPHVNGFEVIRELKAQSPEMLQRTIVITAASDLTLRDFDPTQVRRVLRKPFAIADLISAVEQCLGSRPLSAAPSAPSPVSPTRRGSRRPRRHR